VLLLVLWVFMTLGVLALDFSSFMRDDAMAALNLADETRAYYVAVAGMNRILYQYARERQKNPAGVVRAPTDPDDEDGDGDGKPDSDVCKPDGHWCQGTFGGGTFAVRMTGEDGKIPLNVEMSEEDDAAYAALLRSVVTNLVRGGNQTTGVDKDTDKQISTIVDSILDWRDCDKEARLNGAEDDYYLGLARPHAAKNGYFDSPEELLQVRGVTPDVFYGHDGLPGLVDVFSPYPRGKELMLNASQVSPEVIWALSPGIQGDVPDAEDFLAGRDNDPEGTRAWLSARVDEVMPGLGPRVVVFAEPEVVRVEARAEMGGPRNQAAVAAVMQLPGSDSALPVVYSWLDRAPLRGAGPPPPGEQPAGVAAGAGAGHS
jgi:general secretion pathway protein K